MLNIYENSSYHAIYDDKKNETLIITLTSRIGKEENDFFGKVFFDKLPYDVIYIKSLKNDWYVGSNFKKCLHEIQKIISQKNYKNIIAYGTSMGGYGALCTTSVINVTHLILAAPIWNIHADYEHRWKNDAIRLSNHLSLEDLNETTIYNRNLFTPRINHRPQLAYFIHDQYGVDQEQVAEIKKHLPYVEILVPYAGHIPLASLQRTRILSETLRNIISNAIAPSKENDLPHINWIIHRTRKENIRYISGLLQRIKKRPKLFDMALQYALNKHPQSNHLNIELMGTYLRKNNPQKALDILRILQKNKPNILKTPKIITPFVSQYIAQVGNINDIEDLAEIVKDNLDKTMAQDANPHWRTAELYKSVCHHLENRPSPAPRQ